MKIEKCGNITLINGDCMEFMQSQSDKSFDLAIVDPPYGWTSKEKINWVSKTASSILIMKIITSISNNIKGISKKAGGYIWKKI